MLGWAELLPQHGDDGGVYWKVTTADGTQYFFGRENTDWSSTPNNSALNVTMYAQNSGDVCYDHDSHHCDIAWRWNLAYVVDPVGNLQAYKYEKGRASYQTPGRDVKHYDAAGYLVRVNYGYTTANPKAAYAPQRSDLSYGWRCDYADCPAPTPGDSNAANYSDVPFDLWCGEDASSCPDGPTGPVFFYQKKLNSVTSSYYNGSGYTPVEKVSLDQGWPKYQDTSGTAVMWLRTITRTGYAANGTSQSQPPVSFKGDYEDWLPNRWSTSDAGNYLNKPRITDVYNELGGHAHVTYGQPNACDSQTLDGTTRNAPCVPTAPRSRPSSTSTRPPSSTAAGRTLEPLPGRRGPGRGVPDPGHGQRRRSAPEVPAHHPAHLRLRLRAAGLDPGRR